MRLTAADLGMPFYKKNFVCGNLFITFDVKFPKSLTELQMLSLTTSLSDQKNKGKGNKKSSEEEEVSETCVLSKMQEAHKNVHAGGGKHGRDSDDEEEAEEGGPGGQGVQCA